MLKMAIAITVGLATPAIADGYDLSTRQGCLSELSKAVQMADAWRQVSALNARKYSTIPDFGKDSRENILDALEVIAAEYRIVADELLYLCQEYPPD